MLRAKKATPKAVRQKRASYKLYSAETLQRAYNSITNNEMSVNKASRVFEIPRTTLMDKVHNRTPLHTTQGPKPILTTEEEQQLADWVIQMAKIGYGRTRKELVLVVKKFIDEDGRSNPFKNNTPGKEWVRSFLRRHREISIRVPEALGRERACVTTEKIYGWFDEMEGYFRGGEVDGGNLSIFNNPERIFNADESGFPLAGKTEKVLAPRGAKDVYQQTSSDKTQITVMACANAAGFYLPPMMIFPGVRFNYNPVAGAPEGTFFGRSSNGWIDSEVFYEWVANQFLPTVKSRLIHLPVILFVDGHSTHVNLQTAMFCRDNDIILYCLPSHSTHLIQPLDVAVFRSLKKEWFDCVRQYQTDNPGAQVTKKTFAAVFNISWRSSAIATSAINGFRKCGLFPLNRQAVDISKLQPSSVSHTPAASPSNRAPQPQIHLPQKEITQPSAPSEEHAASSSAQVALEALERVISPGKRQLFVRRRAEGYNLEGDELYTAWNNLIESAETAAPQDPVPDLDSVPSRPSPPVQIHSSAATQRGATITSVFDKYLRYPVHPKGKAPSRTNQHDQVPKAVSGSSFIAYLREKEKKKTDDEERRQQKRKERERKQQAKKLKKGVKASRENNKEDDEDDLLNQDECSACGMPYNKKPENWIGCDGCDRWYHKCMECTGIEGMDKVSADEVEDLDFLCDYCL